MHEIDPVRDGRPGAAGVLGGNGAAARAGIPARGDDARDINRSASLRYRTAEAFVTYGSVLVLHGRLSAQSMHRHRAIELVSALEGHFDIATEDGRIAGCQARIVFPNERHALLGSDGRVARLYVDPGLRRMPPPCARTHVPPGCFPDLARNLSLVRDGRPKLDTTKALIGRWQAAWLPWLATAEAYDPRIATAMGVIDAQAAPSETRAAWRRS